jgi:SpoVK/Ycf46/Vps4 family AAA+-type ATPase
MEYRRAKYEKLTKASLMGICDEKRIEYKSKLKKSEIIDLILDFEAEEIEEEQRSAAEAIFFARGASKEAASAKKAIPKGKAAPKSKDKDVPKGSLKRVSKPSIISNLTKATEYMQKIEESVAKEDKRGAVTYAENLKEILNSSNFEGVETLKTRMKDCIKSVVAAFGGATPAKREDRVYKRVEFDLTTLSAPTQNISITLEELRKEVDKPEFISKMVANTKALLQSKIRTYNKMKDRLTEEYNTIDAKVKKLKSTGTTDKVIEDMYPGYVTLKAYKIDVEDLITLIRERIATLTDDDMRSNLVDAIEDHDSGLMSLTGRDHIKDQMASQIYTLSKGHKMFDGNFNNIAIYGPSGSGKTFTAQVIAYAFSKIGILAKKTIKVVSRADLVGEYVGKTALKTRSVLIETLEGVLFIDEAYDLTHSPESRVGSRDFGGECVTEIVNFMDKYIGLSVIIVAGYEDKMRRNFMTFNEGLPRRFPHVYILQPYTSKELTDILLNNLARALPDDIKLNQDVFDLVYSMVDGITKDNPDTFKNQAGDMLNLSGVICRTIASSYRLSWKNGNIKRNSMLITEGFKAYIRSRS